MKKYLILIPVVKYIECYAEVPDRDEAICRADDLVQMLEDDNVDLSKLYNGKVVYAKPIVKRVKEKSKDDK